VDVDIVAGYLGSGKTSTILAMIARDPDPGSLVVLVNEFGELGIDGALMSGTTEVVELASGCICCTLRLDFRAQIIEIADRWRPRRLLIEPTGVATIAQVVRALRHRDLTRKVAGARIFVLVDAVTFAERLRDSPGFFTSQVEQAHVILLNKTDLVSDARTRTLKAALEQMNPQAWIFTTVKGEIADDAVLPPAQALVDTGEAEVLGGLESRSYPLAGLQERTRVQALFANLAAGRYGTIERAKGVVETPEGWFRYDVASGISNEEPWSPAKDAGLVIIGATPALEDIDQAVRGLSIEA
jgi:G3E family GTPase